MFDTHCHLNFSRFKKNVDEVILKAFNLGVKHITIPGTDIKTSQKAIEIAQQYEGLYAAVGIHPHHVYEIHEVTVNSNSNKSSLGEIEYHLNEIERLLQEKKVVAVGEIGMDRHVYEETKYAQYNVSPEFIEHQKILLSEQVKLAIKYNKSLILHNREAKGDLLPIIENLWDSSLEYHVVFHCCEPDEELLAFAKTHNMFLGVDGDITYYPEKQEFVKKVPLEILVLETDSPFLLPEPMRSQKLFPNSPVHIPFIAEYVAKLKGVHVEELAVQTTKNAKQLFGVL